MFHWFGKAVSILLAICPLVLSQSSATISNSGTFTNAQMNEYTQSLLNSASPLTEFQALEGTSAYATDALTGAVAIPSGAAAHNTNAVAGYLSNSSTGSNGVGGYFQARCLVNGSSCWGANQVVFDATGLTSGLTLMGLEVDTQPQNASTAYSTLIGVNSSLFSPQSGTFNKSYAFYARSPQTGIWDISFVSPGGNAAVALNAGATCTSGTCNSQPIELEALSSGVQVQSTIASDSSGDILLNAASGASVITSVSSSASSFVVNTTGVTWTSGSGAPSSSCGVGSIYTNAGAASASTVLYVCYPSNSWKAVTVP